MKHRVVPLLVAAVAVAALVVGVAQAQTTTADTQHVYLQGHTNFSGWVVLTLPTAVSRPDDVVVKVASGGTHLGGEDPSFATANFANFVNDNRHILVRVLGWHANTVTGRAEFRYYSNKDVDLAVDVYPGGVVFNTPTTAPPTTT